MAIQIAEIFSTDTDFHRELHRGDTFRVIYEALTAEQLKQFQAAHGLNADGRCGPQTWRVLGG